MDLKVHLLQKEDLIFIQPLVPVEELCPTDLLIGHSSLFFGLVLGTVFATSI